MTSWNWLAWKISTRRGKQTRDLKASRQRKLRQHVQLEQLEARLALTTLEFGLVVLDPVLVAQAEATETSPLNDGELAVQAPYLIDFDPGQSLTAEETIEHALPATLGNYNQQALSFTTLANGMPVLNSLPGAPTSIFIDFDGDTQTGTQAYDVDGNSTTFNAAEQATIANAWKQMSQYYAMFDVNVTTIQPPTSTPTNWLAVGNNISGGYAYVGTFPSTYPRGFNQSSDARTRVSGMAHEVGHMWGLSHQSDWDLFGVKIRDYSSGYDTLHGPLMGVDYAGTVHKWIIGHPSGSASSLQDDIQVIANKIKVYQPAGGDGFKADDFGGTIATAAALGAIGDYQAASGILERMNDVDAFRFTSLGGVYTVSALPDGVSGVDLKLEIYDASGALIAAKDGATNSQVLTLALGTGTYYAMLSSHGNYGDVGAYNIAVSGLPAGWTAQDVGTVGMAGSSTYNAATNKFTIEGSGSDIGGTADSMQYAWQTLTGDGTIIARVDSLANTNSLAKAGIEIRETTANNAKHVALVQTYGSGPRTLVRSSVGGNTTSVNSSTQAFAPIWLRLTRVGNVFTASTSTDGTTWTQFGTSTVSMTATVTIGLVTTARTTSQLNAAVFSNVTVTGNLGPAAPVYNSLAAPTGVSVAPATGTGLTIAWTDGAGETGYRVERSTDGVNFTTAGTVAANVATYTDPGLAGTMRYFYRVIALDASGGSVPSAVASGLNRSSAVTSFTITSLNTTTTVLNWRDTDGETGYRVERSTDGVNYTMLTIVGVNVPSYTSTGLSAATSYTYRVTPLSALGDGVAATATGSTRLAAVTGTGFTAKTPTSLTFTWTDLTTETGYQIQRSTDGSTFTTLTTVGANVTTYTDNTVTAANEYYYRVVGTNGSTISVYPTPIFTATPSANALPTPWVASDIGAVAGAGTTDFSGGTFKVISAGADIWGTADQFRYTYQTLTGNGTITARVSAVEDTGGWAKIGVMVRESLAANSKHAMLLVSPANGVAMQYRSSTGGSSTSVLGPAVTAPYWVRMTRIGNTLTGYASADGVTWTQVSSVTISMTSTVYFGLSADANTSTLLNTSSFTNVSVTNTTPSVTNAATVVNAQNMTGLVLTPNPADGTSITHFQITGITNGTLYQANGTTPIAEGQFITIAQGAAGLKFLPAANSTATGSFQAKASLNNTVSGLSGNAVTATITVAPLVTVESTVINGGLTGGNQRSIVKNLTVTFSGLVTTPIASGSFVVTQQPSGTPVAVQVNTATVGGKTVATLTFSGAGTENGSLMDGNYQLSINGALLKDALGYSIDADANQTVGGTRLFGQGASTAATDKFFRLFGDYDGDRDVDNSDLLRFRTTQNRLSSDALFLWFMDFDQDGDVDNTDLLRFRLRFGSTLS